MLSSFSSSSVATVTTATTSHANGLLAAVAKKYVGSNATNSAPCMSLVTISKRSMSSSSSNKNATATTAKNTVRLIALKDLPYNKGYKGDVLHVKSGYARNYLLPQKMAVYATPQNFEKYQITDPDIETEEERKARLLRESSMSETEEKYLKASDVLKKYLKNKVLKIWRVVDPNSTDVLHPGYVTSYNIRQKLATQLKIDLEPHERIDIVSSEPMDAILTGAEKLDDDKIQTMIEEFATTSATTDSSNDHHCNVKIRRLGTYLAKISLDGGYAVPLKFVVRQRVP